MSHEDRGADAQSVKTREDEARGTLIGTTRYEGEPIHAHGHVVTPIIEVVRRGGVGGQPGDPGGGRGHGRGGGGGIRVSARPVAVRVQGPDDSEHELPLAEPRRSALRSMCMSALAIGLLGWILGRLLRGSGRAT